MLPFFEYFSYVSNCGRCFTHTSYYSNINLTTTMQEKFYLSHSSEEKTKILKAKLAARGLSF